MTLHLPDLRRSARTRRIIGQRRVAVVTRIQRLNRDRDRIRDAALEVFSRRGFVGATLGAIAEAAGLSKPNPLDYVASKEAIYAELLASLLNTWLAPLRAIDPAGDPEADILAYMRRRLDLWRQMPRESRLFATEILHRTPLIGDTLATDLRRLADEVAAVIEGWAAAGRIAPVDGRRLVISSWAMTQH